MTRLEIGFVVVAGVWAGLVLGVSFVATPAKFLASSITLPIALDVGRSTFRVSLLIELFFASALVATGAIAFGWGGKTLVAAGILAALAVQRFVLLPSLDARTTLVIAGAQLPPSWHHLVWIAADALRFLMLLGLCVVALGDSRALSEVTAAAKLPVPLS